MGDGSQSAHEGLAGTQTCHHSSLRKLRSQGCTAAQACTENTEAKARSSEAVSPETLSVVAVLE